MLISNCLNIDDNQTLSIGGASTQQLAQEYGTPLYVMDEEFIRKNIAEYKTTISNNYHGDGNIYYASKAFLCKYMCKIAQEEGIGLDVVSDGELYTAINSGFDPTNICFHGSNKSDKEIEMAIGHSVGFIVCDSVQEIHRVSQQSKLSGKQPQRVILRIKPEVEAHTHEFIQTGKTDSKFGVTIDEARQIFAIHKELHVEIKGIHAHIGSQIFESQPFLITADKMIALMSELNNDYGCQLTHLNLGGGIGIKYVESDQPLSIQQFVTTLTNHINESCKNKNIQPPFLMLEPGRSIVGNAGLTLYRVGTIKENVRKYVSIDGGMADNPRYIMYQAEYTAYRCNNPLDTPCENVTLVGKACESGDIIIKDLPMPKLEVGDLVAVLQTGAYNFSMASNYNRIPRPAVVMTNKGSHKLVVRRQSYEDLLANDI